MIVDDERPVRISNFETCESTAVLGRYRRCRSVAVMHASGRHQLVSPSSRAPTTTVLRPSTVNLLSDDASEDMAALGSLATWPTPTYGGNVVALRR
jgi:hypothetical protein